MGEKKTKKTEEELRDELEKQQQDKFIEALREVEEKHGYKLQPILHYSVTGVVPQITVQKVKAEQITVK